MTMLVETEFEVAPVSWAEEAECTDVLFVPLVIPDIAFTVRVTLVLAPGARVTEFWLRVEGTT